jgi:ribose 5-phosphate isomerase A
MTRAESEEQAGKAATGRRAAEAVDSGMVLGLGSGSTVFFFLQALGRRLREGSVSRIVGVPTSRETEERARQMGIPLITLVDAGTVDLTVDGADEVDPALDLIKGMGGALLREKMVAQASRRFVIIVDDQKLVPRLGVRSPLPVEVAPFGWDSHLDFLRGLGADPALRTLPGGEPLFTDNGNHILDCIFPDGIPDPGELSRVLSQRAGVVEDGLFLGMADEVLVGAGGKVRTLKRSGVRSP